jgi:hypothetical protein
MKGLIQCAFIFVVPLGFLAVSYDLYRAFQPSTESTLSMVWTRTKAVVGWVFLGSLTALIACGVYKVGFN